MISGFFTPGVGKTQQVTAVEGPGLSYHPAYICIVRIPYIDERGKKSNKNIRNGCSQMEGAEAIRTKEQKCNWLAWERKGWREMSRG